MSITRRESERLYPDWWIDLLRDDGWNLEFLAVNPPIYTGLGMPPGTVWKPTKEMCYPIRGMVPIPIASGVEWR